MKKLLALGTCLGLMLTSTAFADPCHMDKLGVLQRDAQKQADKDKGKLGELSRYSYCYKVDLIGNKNPNTTGHFKVKFVPTGAKCNTVSQSQFLYADFEIVNGCNTKNESLILSNTRWKSS